MPPVDNIMGGYGAPTLAYGTNRGASGVSDAPWGSFPNAASNYVGVQPQSDVAGEGYDWWNSPQNQQTSQNYSDFDPWFASLLDIGGGVDMSGGGGFYGGGEDFGLSDGGYYDDEWY